jgi:hypothetical protein
MNMKITTHGAVDAVFERVLRDLEAAYRLHEEGFFAC